MSRIFTAGPIDFEVIDSIIEYRTQLHASLREHGHEPVDQYTEFLEAIAEIDMTTAESVLTADLEISDLSDEPFANIVEHAIEATSMEEVIESPGVVPGTTSDELLDRLVERDMELLRSADKLIAYQPRPSCGTMVEIVRADEAGLPVVVVSESPPHYPRRFADAIAPTLSEGISEMDSLLESQFRK